MADSLVSNENLEDVLSKIDIELSKIQPEIDYLEECVMKLKDLQEKKSRLLSFKISVHSLLKFDDKSVKNTQNTNGISEDSLVQHNVTLSHDKIVKKQKVFVPETALERMQNLLRGNDSINHLIYKSIVYAGGIATTTQIKQYLIDNKIKQPKSQAYFNDVPLKEISSRVNYLVRKGLIFSDLPGQYISVYGWVEIN